ncbi:MAG TPA: hypothetical protein VK633_12685, partial [Verrucomicrobiae bacterium]|nr:hypothetical protein [Verrucomicrobiae bacterium]
MISDPNGFTPDHLAPRSIRDASFDSIFQLISGGERSFEKDFCSPLVVRLQSLALHHLSGIASA